jgi:RND family efflux transporter MFP subunit
VLRPHLGSGADSSPSAKREEQAPTVSESGVITLTGEGAALAGIRVVQVEAGSVESVILAAGRVQANAERSARVGTLVSGRIRRLLAKPGDRVSAGQVLALVSSREVAEAQAAYQQARADLIRARAALDNTRRLANVGALTRKPLEEAEQARASAQAELQEAQAVHEAAHRHAERARRLFDEGIASRRDLESAEAEDKGAEAKLEAANTLLGIADAALARERRVYSSQVLSKQEVQKAQADYAQAQAEEEAAASTLRLYRSSGGSDAAAPADIPVSSPIAGVVIERPAVLGQTVEPSSDLFTVVDLSSVWVEVDVYEKDIPRVAIGQPVAVAVTAFPEAAFSGRVSFISPTVDETTRTIRVRCQVANSAGQLRPEMFVQARIQAERRAGGALVPESAIQEDQGKQFVYVALGKGRFKRRNVTLGGRIDSHHEVIAGLQPGDRVVTTGSFLLKSEELKGQMEED